MGHSLGAGAAILATLLLCGDQRPLSRLMAASKVKCYAFAPPPTFEPLWALPPWVHASTYSFVHNMDCLPRACLGTVAKLYLAIRHVDALPLTTQQRVAYLRSDILLDHTLPDFVEIPAESQASLGSIFGVGSIILLYKKDGKMQCDTVSPHMTDRILMCPSMLSDHSISNYEHAIHEACNGPDAAAGCTIG